MKSELDRRRKYYLILDCETATLPYVSNIKDADARQKIAIAKPLIYDIGWTVIDKKGNIYKKKSFLISEIFSVPSTFNTAYYKEKRPIYLERLQGGAIDLVTWEAATKELVHDMELVEGVGAYNAMFDFKKAIPFTETYISKLYSPDFDKWEKFQNSTCDDMAAGYIHESDKDFNPNIFQFRDKTYNLFDVWALACNHLINNDEYKRACLENGWKSRTNKYFSTNAENVFKFCSKNIDFEEEHTALSDAEIESFLFSEAVKKTKGKIEFGIIYFPFRILGLVENFQI